MPLKTLTGKHADPRKGRGAGINPEGRFASVTREAYDDGWNTPEEELPPLRTYVTAERVKSIISRNDSPDIPFTQSINPYQGCEVGCVYCLAGDTPILMADGTHRPLARLRVDDEIYGTVRHGWFRRYVKSRVLAHWSVVKPSYRITLEDGTSIVAGPDHRFLTERGWKYVTGTMSRSEIRRPYLTMNNKLMGTGAFSPSPTRDRGYRVGYLCGMIRGDGLLGEYHYQRVGRTHGNQYQFRLALCDLDALARTRDYLNEERIATHDFVFQRERVGYQAMHAIRTYARLDVARIRTIVEWPSEPSFSWFAGFLAGIFDAEGSYRDGIIRIGNTDGEIIAWISRSLRALGFEFVLEVTRPESARRVHVVRVVGGLRAHLRFLHGIDPAIRRKCDISGQAVKSEAKLRVVDIEPLGKAMRLFDITTETGDFIANGVVSHNCYARPTHAYRDLSPGIDFETRLFAKVNAAEMLREELARPGYRCEVISIGANTDPYQPIEREWKVTRGILEVLAEHDHPLGIVTKNAMVERDLDILAPMARKNLVNVFISVNNLDHDLARRLEPRCSAPARRLKAMKRLSEAGVPVGVVVAPVIPFLTDHQIEPMLEAAWQHGARQAAYILMRLPWEVKDLFKEWLERNYPLKAKHVMSRVHAMRGGRDNDPNFGSRMKGEGELARLLAQRFRQACQRLGFNAKERNRELDTTQFHPPRRGGQLELF
jgi:DNA repair photolyase